MSSYAADLFRYAVLALQRQGSRELNSALAPLGLTASQAEALRVLDVFGSMTVKEVGEHLVCENGSPSRLMSSLADRGLISRASNNTDRRKQVLALTEAGKQLAAQIASIEAAYVGELAQILPDNDVLESIATTLARAVTDPQLQISLSKRFPDVISHPGAVAR